MFAWSLATRRSQRCRSVNGPARFTEKYAVNLSGGGGSRFTSSCILQPLLSPSFSLLLRAISSAEDIALMLCLGEVDNISVTPLAEAISNYCESARPLNTHWFLFPIEGQA